LFGFGDVECFGDGLWDLCCVGYEVVVFGDWYRDVVDVGFLEGVCVDCG